MKLIFKGHEYKYAAEQIMMSVLPDMRPEYGDNSETGDFARISLSRGEKYVTASVKLNYKGGIAYGTARENLAELSDKRSFDSACQRIIRIAFYRAAIKRLPEKPVWGAITGIRPGTIFTKLLKSGMDEKSAVKEMQRAYFVDEDRALLCADTSRASLKTEERLNKNDIALYVGIPFCPTRCAYCSFVSQSVERSMALIPPFLEALYRELCELGKIVRELKLNVIAVYIGGGTPTTLTAEQLGELIERLKENFDFSNVEEFSVEAGRPDTITEEKLIALQKGGVTRISINPQSFSDDVLAAIGRRHSASDVLDAFRLSRRTMTADINMDLIAGLPADTPESFIDTLRKTIALEPENITVHTLSLKKGTKITLEGAALPDKEAVGEMIGAAQRELTAAGYKPYYLYRQKYMSGGFENIGWAKTGKESLYNILIMEELCTILAAGGGASTKLVNTETGRIERIFDFKYPKEFVAGIDKLIEDKQKIKIFYGV